jgi:hypothetical protein
MRPKGRSRRQRSPELDVGNIDRAIADVAAGQRGDVSRDQLLALRLSAEAIKRRVRARRLRPIFRGVYLVGAVMSPGSREMAAALVYGDHAYVSYVSAARLHRLLPLSDRNTLIHITVCERRPRPRPGIHLHYARRLEPDETMKLGGIPVTTPARTILDLAAEVGPSELERLVAEAFALNLTNRPQLLRLVDRYPGRRGTRALRALLEAPEAPRYTHSTGERRMLALLRKAELPRPQVNVRLHGWKIDFLWAAKRLVVEVDGYAAHSSPSSFERDRRKDSAGSMYP